MFLNRAKRVRIQTERMILRLPAMQDHAAWVRTRRDSEEFLKPWEPIREGEMNSRAAFKHRVRWAAKEAEAGRACPLLLIRREDNQVLGALTLDNIRRGPARAGTIGYWIGKDFARQGYMEEALLALVNYAFTALDLSRLEAACLPENAPSRSLLEKAGFKYEGVAQSYLQIAGRWRTHVLYANLRHDRRGRTQSS